MGIPDRPQGPPARTIVYCLYCTIDSPAREGVLSAGAGHSRRPTRSARVQPEPSHDSFCTDCCPFPSVSVKQQKEGAINSSLRRVTHLKSLEFLTAGPPSSPLDKRSLGVHDRVFLVEDADWPVQFLTSKSRSEVSVVLLSKKSREGRENKGGGSKVSAVS